MTYEELKSVCDRCGDELQSGDDVTCYECYLTIKANLEMKIAALKKQIAEIEK